MLVAWAGFLLSGFLAARVVEPDPRGFGTHTQFGLPGCSIQQVFGRPCPGCGMTTSFAHFVRGDLVAAARANPAGLLLASLCLIMIPWCLVTAIRGELWLTEEPLTLIVWAIVTIGVVALVAWTPGFFRSI